MSDVIERDAAAYGARLAELFERTGATRKELADTAILAASTITRYFNGERIAPKAFLDGPFSAFFTARGVPLCDAELHALRRTAQHNSSKDSARVAYWTEEAEALRVKKDAFAQSLQQEKERGAEFRRQATERLSALEHRLTMLSEELSEGAERSQALEEERDQALAVAEEKQRQLDHAAAYTRQQDEELAKERQARAREREKAAWLRREAEVLRGQVRRLMAGPSQPASEAVPGAGTPVTAARTPVRREEKRGRIRAPIRSSSHRPGHRMMPRRTSAARAACPTASLMAGVIGL